jgi:hypothetical protein
MPPRFEEPVLASADYANFDDWVSADYTDCTDFGDWVSVDFTNYVDFTD